jgi:hypothetical protein
MALAPLSDVNAGRVRHPDGEADRRSRHKGRAAGTQARTIQLPQAPSAWIRAGDRHQPWIIGVPRTPADGHAGGMPRQNRPPLRSSKRLPRTSVSLPGITLSDGRGPGERAQSRRYERRERMGVWPQRGSRSGNSVSRPDRQRCASLTLASVADAAAVLRLVEGV